MFVVEKSMQVQMTIIIKKIMAYILKTNIKVLIPVQSSNHLKIKIF